MSHKPHTIEHGQNFSREIKMEHDNYDIFVDKKVIFNKIKESLAKIVFEPIDMQSADDLRRSYDMSRVQSYIYYGLVIALSDYTDDLDPHKLTLIFSEAYHNRESQVMWQRIEKWIEQNLRGKSYIKIDSD